MCNPIQCLWSVYLWPVLRGSLSHALSRGCSRVPFKARRAGLALLILLMISVQGSRLTRAQGSENGHKADGKLQLIQSARPNGLSVDAAGLVVSLNRDLAFDPSLPCLPPSLSTPLSLSPSSSLLSPPPTPLGKSHSLTWACDGYKGEDSTSFGSSDCSDASSLASRQHKEDAKHISAWWPPSVTRPG